MGGAIRVLQLHVFHQLAYCFIRGVSKANLFEALLKVLKGNDAGAILVNDSKDLSQLDDFLGIEFVDHQFEDFPSESALDKMVFVDLLEHAFHHLLLALSGILPLFGEPGMSEQFLRSYPL